MLASKLYVMITGFDAGMVLNARNSFALYRAPVDNISLYGEVLIRTAVFYS